MLLLPLKVKCASKINIIIWVLAPLIENLLVGAIGQGYACNVKRVCLCN